MSAASPPSALPRKRPLRTYGKKAALTDRDTPPPTAKRTKHQHVPSPRTIAPGEDPSPPPISCAASPKPQSSPKPQFSAPQPAPKKGSILHFFKPAASAVEPTPPPSETNALSPDAPMHPHAASSSPPPIIPSGTRERRRLVTRPLIAPHKFLSHETSPCSTTPRGRVSGDDSTCTHTTSAAAATADSPENNTSPVQQSPFSQQEAVPREITAHPSKNSDSSRVYGLREDHSQEKEGMKKNKKRGQKKRPAERATVQTTISLSLDDGGYTECRECDMLYNPLHDKDAKYHARRHAAMMKKRTAATKDV